MFLLFSKKEGEVNVVVLRLKLKTWPKHLLGYLPLALALPALSLAAKY
jgi:hypothetical protein